MVEEWEEELATGLEKAGEENVRSKDITVPEAMRNISEPIAEAIRNSSIISFKIKGIATCDEINVMTGMEEGDLWSVSDDGIIFNEKDEIDVCCGDIVAWSGGKWDLFLHIDLSGYAKAADLSAEAESRKYADSVLSAVMAQIRESVTAHVSRDDNPHSVTAEQVGSYTKQETDTRIENAINKKGLRATQGILYFG